MMLSPEVLAITILNSIFLLFSIIAFILSIKIFLKWNIDATSKIQYDLERQSYLASTIIKYILATKILLFFFFVFTLDKISNVLTGAMCAAGVIDATSYGTYLLLFKLINMYLFGFWLLIHKYDSKTVELKYTKAKFGFFIFIFFLLLTEIIIELTMFSSIDVDKLVSCCGTIYSNSSTSYFSTLLSSGSSNFLIAFYICFALLVLFYFIKNSYLYTLFSLIFLIISLVSLISFFSTYIYELPTHHCPFCMLQKEYTYVGYLLYALLFSGTFTGLAQGIKKLFLNESSLDERLMKQSIILVTLYTICISLYPLVFYFKNGVWL